MAPDPMPPAFALIAEQRNPAADDALAAALPHLERAEQEAAFSILIERAEPAGLATVVGGFATADESLRRLTLEHVGHLYTGVRLAIESTSQHERLSAIDLVVQGQHAKLAYLLARALRSTSVNTRQRAADGLATMTARLIEEGRGADDQTAIALADRQEEHVADALRAAVASWEIHHQPNVLAAALWLGDRVEPAIRRKLGESRTRLVQAVDDMLLPGSDPRLAGFCLRALTMEPIRTAAVRAIGHTVDRPFIRALASQAWLLADPAIRRECRRIREFRWLEHGVDNLLSLDAAEAAAIIRLLATTGMPHDRKLALFQEAADAGIDGLDTAAVWAITEDATDEGADALALLAARGSVSIARVARLELRRRRSDDAILDIEPPDRADDPPVDVSGATPEVANESSSAEPMSADDAWDRLWRRFDSLSASQRRPLVDRLTQPDGEATDRVRTKLSSKRPIERTRALLLTRELGVIQELAEAVFRLARDSDAVVRSTAVGLLPDLPGPTTRRILRDLSDDPDPRVQANVVEALGRLGGSQCVRLIEPKLESRHSRVRANAIKVLMQYELHEAAEALLTMLEHRSGSQRLSALWVVQRLQLSTVLNRVSNMSEQDPDERVRRRAQRLLGDFSGPDDAGVSGAPRKAAQRTC